MYPVLLRDLIGCHDSKSFCYQNCYQFWTNCGCNSFGFCNIPYFETLVLTTCHMCTGLFLCTFTGFYKGLTLLIWIRKVTPWLKGQPRVNGRSYGKHGACFPILKLGSHKHRAVRQHEVVYV